jgi:hypothetical protein
VECFFSLFSNEGNRRHKASSVSLARFVGQRIHTTSSGRSQRLRLAAAPNRSGRIADLAQRRPTALMRQEF